MELNSLVKNPKKPAMALVLIIIIITSISVVIMGTLKIITKSSDKFSINKNSRGFANLRKPQGKFICFKYNDKLYQAQIKYDAHQNVIIPENYVSATEPLARNCEFTFPEDAVSFKFTLIGGGSGGAKEQFGNNVNFKYDPNQNIKKSDFKDNLDNYSISGLTWGFYMDSIDYTLRANDGDLDEQINIIQKNKYCYTGDSCYFESKSNDRGMTDLISSERYDAKFKFNIVSDKKILPGFEYNDDGSSFASIKEFLKAALQLDSDSDSDIIKCAYSPYVTYTTYSQAPAGKVLEFNLSKADLGEINKITICASEAPGCNGVIGDGGNKDSKAGESTEFRINDSINSTGNSDVTQSKEISDNNINVYDLIGKSGLEANYTLSSDFKLNKHGFNLHSGYYEKDSMNQLTVHPATLFGSSSSIIYPHDNRCADAASTPHYESPSAPGNECKTKYNGIKSCNDLPSVDPTQQNLKGAPGAIIIEW